MLETIRQYGFEKLTETPEGQAVRARHRDFYLGIAEDAESRFQGPEQVAWLKRLETDHDNLRAALRWSLDRDETEPALTSISSRVRITSGTTIAEIRPACGMGRSGSTRPHTILIRLKAKSWSGVVTSWCPKLDFLLRSNGMSGRRTTAATSEVQDLKPSTFTAEYKKDGLCRILSLDGGGAKGFYTLGVLKEIEGMLKCPLYKRFDLVFGTSTGAIIASLIALGRETEEIHELYKEHVPKVMKVEGTHGKSQALAKLADKVFGKATFEDVKTGIGVVATKWVIERPMIFKGDVAQAHGRLGTFKPGFGVSISDAVQASCSAYPFFDRKIITTADGDKVELVDGGYCANNPTLYAIADAVEAMKKDRGDLRVVSVGVGVYPEPKPKGVKMWLAKRYLRSVQLLQKTLEINTQSLEQLRAILFKDIRTIRISDTFEKPEMATDLMEHDLDKLNILRQRGRESFADRERELREFLV